MKSKNDILRELLSEYQQQQEKDRQENESRLQSVIEKCPEIGRLQQKKRELIIENVRRATYGEKTDDKITEKMAELIGRTKALLTQNGFGEDYLQPQYRCGICRDTGYIGDGIQEMCQCLKTRLYEDYGREMGLSERQKQTFETFSLSVFPQDVIPEAGVSQRALMQVIKKRCEKYADDFPETQTDNLLLYGASGLGKTFLMHAIAHRVIERGYSVLIISAYRMFELMRRAHRDGDDAGLQPLFDAELLLIDDLGTEPMMENITVIQLFNLLNERAVRRLKTAVCTNLTPKELQERYTERVTSRLLDRQTTMQLCFMGRDIRLSER